MAGAAFTVLQDRTMRFTENPYNLLGLALALTGGAMAAVSYLILDSIPLTALGMSMVILGVISLTLGRTRPKISPEASAILLETGLENMAAIVEELGLRSKAIYVPSSLTDGRPRALVPLHSNSRPVQVTEAGVGVESAVGALSFAERYVDVQRCGIHGRSTATAR